MNGVIRRYKISHKIINFAKNPIVKISKSRYLSRIRRNGNNEGKRNKKNR